MTPPHGSFGSSYGRNGNALKFVFPRDLQPAFRRCTSVGGSMAYDRYDPERRWRDDDDRRAFGWDRDRDDPRFHRGDRGREDRGFFERMGDEFRSWFGDEDRDPDYGRDRDQDRWRPTYGERDYNPRWSDELGRGPRRPVSDYREDYDRGDVWDRDPSRRTSFAGSRVNSSHEDLHYGQWRRQQMQDLDREYDAGFGPVDAAPDLR